MGHARWKTLTLLVLASHSLPLSIAATLYVPADYPTIQACIDASVSGVDECVVAPGTYNETINFLGKAITVRSSGGAEVTTIDATGIGGSVVTCANGENPGTVLDGFTITGGTGTDVYRDGYTYGGGMYNYYSSPTVVNCAFVENAAVYEGGGMRNYSGAPTVTHCTFLKNSAIFGGGISNYYADTTVTYCIFRGNKAESGAGGGIYNVHSHPVVTNSCFSGNTADSGAGILIVGSSSLIVRNSTFSGNRAAHFGGAIYDRAIYAGTISGCVLWGNTPDAILNRSDISFSDVQGGLPAGAVDGGGNVDLDPMFVRPPDPGSDGAWDGVDDDYGDLRLQGGSPCINAGDPGFVAQPGETDLEGHARVLCGRVDMGGYEFGIGDHDCNQTVNLNDFTAWTSCMNGPQATALADEPPVAPGTADTAVAHNPGCEAFDFDGDGDVDLLDFSEFQKIIEP